MLYPSLSDYSTIIRHPQFAFRKKDTQTQQENDLDPILVNGKPVETLQNGTKSLWFAAGGFACVFKFETYHPHKFWAVRCFKKSTSDVALHYKKVSSNLQSIQGSSCASYFIDFAFLEEGIRVNGNCYPILKMEWVEGKDLKTYIRDNLNNTNKLNALAKAWIHLCIELSNAGITHGDLQHGNILIDDKNGLDIKLIDYDSLYFHRNGAIIDDQIKGLQGYQHPLRDSLQKQCQELDFFSEWVIYISIIALAEKKSLWHTYKLDDADDRLLFSKTDFQQPDRANNIFDELSNISPNVAALALEMKNICKLRDFNQISFLNTVLNCLTSSFVNKLPSNTLAITINKNPTTSQSPSSTSVSWNPGGPHSNLNRTPSQLGNTIKASTPVSWNPGGTQSNLNRAPSQLGNTIKAWSTRG